MGTRPNKNSKDWSTVSSERSVSGWKGGGEVGGEGGVLGSLGGGLRATLLL